MSPQFVDFDADGRTDIVAGIFDGSPHVARGTADGFEQPVQILDRDGARIVLNQFWNFDTKKWDETTRCDPDGGAPARGHGTSAWALDWDRDGDLDLLLGDYDGGYLFLRLNEGTKEAPAFATKNVLVEAEGKPIHVDKTATMRLVDWTGDGHADLVVGSMGDTYGDKPGGGVFVYPAVPGGDTARFGAPVTLVPPSNKGQAEPTRPDCGLYMDLADHDGDGDLDLVVGGYSMWNPPPPALTPAQQEHVKALQDETEELSARMRVLNKAIWDDLEHLEEAEQERQRKEILTTQSDERQRLGKRLRELETELDPLVPGTKRRSFVWLYENLTAGGTGAAPGDR